MITFTTQLLTDETKLEVSSYENAINFANSEEALYLDAMTKAGTDFDRRNSLVEAFNTSVKSFSFHYGV
jgi:hypothetical protein